MTRILTLWPELRHKRTHDFWTRLRIDQHVSAFSARCEFIAVDGRDTQELLICVRENRKSGPKLAIHIRRLLKSFGISADENGWRHPQGAVAQLRLADEGIAQA
jgi:hypothetical protein